MKKRILSIVLALVMMVSLVAGAVPALAAEDGITLRLHYHREDGNYEGWEMWFWDYDGNTSLDPPYQFTEENGEMVSTIEIKTGTTKIGYIVREGEWVSKDVDYDQFINLTGILSGTVDFYVESGKATQATGGIDGMPDMQTLVDEGYMVLGDDVETGVIITEAKYVTTKAEPEITVMTSSKLDYEADLNTFSVYNNDGEVEITNMVALGSYYFLTLGEDLDLARGYNISFEGREYAITMPDYFSNTEFESQFTYEGDDLGATYTAESTALRVWAPTAVNVSVNLYSDGDPSVQPDPIKEVPMTKDVNGTWVTTLDGDMNGTYYTYKVYLDTEVNEACDPYARTTGVNGKRAMIIDLDSTNPEGWDKDSNPHAGESYTDAIIYELHIRDLSSDSSSGISAEHVGKYLGLIETGTTNSNGIATGLDHMVDLGITHVHLLPVYDLGSVDESKLDDDSVNHFNWGYDPVNYNVPEGSYSTDPYHGEVRVKEFKQMVQGLHNAGISVIMDVVYNHVYDSGKFCVNQIVPGYFSRPNSNGSGCGNDTASERSMVHKYIVDSVNYWADEYHIDGFRFDLVGLLDTATINEIVETVHENHPDVIFYGEGWEMSTTLTKTGYTMSTMFNSTKTPGFAYFSDTMRNTIKGATYGGVSAGYISGASVSAGDLTALFKGLPSWCSTPTQTINYVSCHDNNTLFDHISIVKSNATLEEKAAMNKLAAAFYMTSQGIPFFQAGEEFLRSKPDADSSTGYNENSYNKGDEMNSLKWDDLNNEVYANVYEYYKGLIAFRKAHPALRMTTASDVNSNIFAASGLDANVSAFTINGGVNGETAESLYVIFNAGSAASTVTLPEGEWNVCINAEKAGTTSIEVVSGSVEVAGVSAMVLVKGEVDSAPTTDTNTGNTSNNKGVDHTVLYICLAIAAVAVIAVVIIILKKK